MQTFAGFSPGKMRFTSIPAQFFTELLPRIDHLGELKVSLYAFWQLDQREGNFRYLLESDFSNDELFMLSFEDQAGFDLSESLEQCVQRGTLLSASVTINSESVSIYMLNTERGREAINTIESGGWQPSDDPHYPIELAAQRPNIFRLYEENIGALTPLIADTLHDAEKNYSEKWISEAVNIAVTNNVRKWAYIEAILNSWKEEGKDERTNRGDSEKDRRKYVEGKFSQFINR